MKNLSRHIIRVLWKIFITGWALLCLLFLLIWTGIIGYLPPIEELQNPIDKFASQVISSEGEVMGSYAHSGDNRILASYDEISPNVIDALIATEDVRFRKHSGIDMRSLMRVLVKRVFMNQSSAGGGSTITQQLAKQLYSPPTRNFMVRLFQKPIEWVIALKLERYYTKDEIIAMYLNKFDFLYNAVGIRQAARTYFGVTPAELNAEQAALLVGMCKNPSYYNPILHKDTDRALQRRNTVFDQMVKADVLSTQQADSLKMLPIVTNFHRATHREGAAPYFREYLRIIMMADKPQRSKYASWQRQQYTDDSLAWETNPLYGWCKKNKKADGKNYDIYTDGLKIYTTVSVPMQQYAEQAVREQMEGFLQPAFDRQNRGRANAPFSSSITDKEREAILLRSIKQTDRWRIGKKEGLSEAEILAQFKRKTTMQVWSWKGTVDTTMTPLDSILYYKSLMRTGFVAMDPHNGHVKAYVGGIDFSTFQYDMVSMGRRQVGSTIKPYLYSLSMIEGASPCDMILHVQPDIVTEAGVRWNVRNSNGRRIGEMVSIKWGLQNSDNWITATLMSRTSPHTFVRLLRSYGLAGEMEAQPAISLGTCDASVMEMASGYTAFVNNGIRVRPLLVTHISDKYGNTVATFSPQVVEVLPVEASLKMLDMLQGVVSGGTAGRLRSSYNLQMPLGGKTGTTQNNSDAWFVGFTPDLVGAVWVGGEDRSIRFNSMALGQGAAAALPIFGKFIRSVYSDKKLKYKSDKHFDIPANFSPCSDGVVADIYTIEGVLPIDSLSADDYVYMD